MSEVSAKFIDYLHSLNEVQRSALLGAGGAGIGALSGYLLAAKNHKTGLALGAALGGAAGIGIGSSMDTVSTGPNKWVWSLGQLKKRYGIVTLPERLMGSMPGIGDRG